ncbi:MAG: SDR family oxidoreductase [Chloroflexota bacterium]
MTSVVDADERPRVVLVTGAAGAIGSATVNVFLRAGFRVVGFDRTPSAGELPSDRYTGFRVDLRDEVALTLAVTSATPQGELAHVIGIAGGALDGEPGVEDLVQLEADLFRQSLEANLTTQFLVLKAVLPWLRRSPTRDRSVVLTSSFNALAGWGMPAYSAAKAGLIGMVQALTGPLGAEGIRINAVAPGTIRTPRTERIWSTSPGHFEALEKTTALGRLGDAADVARTFLALATVLTHVTGQVIVVDGGQMTKRP